LARDVEPLKSDYHHGEPITLPAVARSVVVKLSQSGSAVGAWRRWLVVACAAIGLTGCGEIDYDRDPPILGAEETPMLCVDGFDNDGDGFLDCFDDGCASLATCATLENNDVTCSDGIDNDGNGFADCNDRGCFTAENVRVCGPREPEDTDERCSDGIDNDRNGFVDCNDFACSRNPEITVCGERVDENTDELCSDGISNDGDPYVDCDDFDCSDNEDVTVCDE